MPCLCQIEWGKTIIPTEKAKADEIRVAFSDEFLSLGSSATRDYSSGT